MLTVLYQNIPIAMTRTFFKANETTNLKAPPLKCAFGESNDCRRGQYAKFTPLQAEQNDNFCMDSLIAHMHRSLIKAIG